MKTFFALLFSISVLSQPVVENSNLDFEAIMDVEFVSVPSILGGFNDYKIVAERSGKIWVCNLQNGAWVKRSTPIIDLTGETTTDGERGLQSIEADKDFVWIYYTVEEDTYYTDEMKELAGFDEIPTTTFTVNRIVRYQVSWGANFIDPDRLVLAEIPSMATNHNGGGMVEEGQYLYYATGDSASAPYKSIALAIGAITENENSLSQTYRSQSLSSKNGKIHRVFSAIGNPPQNNPFFVFITDPAATIWATGFRNPWRMELTPESNLIVSDVGSQTKEEINIVSTEFGGQNFGWRAYEGFVQSTSFDTTLLDPYDDEPYTLDTPEDFDIYESPEDNHLIATFPGIEYSSTGVPETRLPDFTDLEFTPITDDNAMEGSSVSSGVFIKEGFHEDYDGKFIFTDVFRSWFNLGVPNDSSGRYFSHTEPFEIPENISLVTDIEQYGDTLYVSTLSGNIYLIYFEETLSIKEVLKRNDFEMGLKYEVTDLLGRVLKNGIIGVDFLTEFYDVEDHQAYILNVEGYGAGFKFIQH